MVCLSRSVLDVMWSNGFIYVNVSDKKDCGNNVKK
jgi:hypothetical protein